MGRGGVSIRPHRGVLEGVGFRSARRGVSSWMVLTVCALALLLAACSGEPVNSPYSRDEAAQNVLHTAFTQRSPKYLDPASSYSTDETPFTYSIYEPLYAYDYLMRPYRLVPKAAEAVVQPRYYDARP